MAQRMDYNAASPAAMKALGVVYGHIRHSGLPTRLVDLVMLRVSQLNGCAYCIDMHTRDLLRAGMSFEHLVLVSVWHDAASLFSDEERTALAWAEEVTQLGDHGVSDDAFAAVSAVFEPKRLADLTLAIALMNAYNRMAISFRAAPLALEDKHLNVSTGLDKQVDESFSTLSQEPDALESPLVACSVCQHDIPLSAAISREASDYVEYFCGLECYERWRQRSGT